MSAMKQVYEDVIELTVEAVEAGANNVNAQTPIRVDEDVIESIWEQMFSWHEDDLIYHVH